jgi:hypothetical protein
MLIAFILTNIQLIQVRGQSTEIRVVNPHTGTPNFEFFTNTTFVGTRFNVTIRVYDVINLYDFQVQLKYNASVINATRAWTPSDEPDYTFYGMNSLGIPAYFYYDDPTYGTSALMGDTLLGIDAFNGSGLMAIVEFEIINRPDIDKTLSCNLEINNLFTFMDDLDGQDITVTKIDGSFRYSSVPPLMYLALTPQIHEASKLESFNVTVWINNTMSSQELVFIKFRLSYDPAILNVTQVNNGTFLNGFGDPAFNSTMEIGSVIIENYINPPYNPPYPAGDGIIAIITFEGIYQDIVEQYRQLQFSETQFLNTTNGDVAVITIDGAYRIEATSAEITIELFSESWKKQNGVYWILDGSTVKINGSISPIKENENVTVSVFRAGEEEGIILSTLTDQEGQYSYDWRTNDTDSYLQDTDLQFRARWEEGITVIAVSDMWCCLRILVEKQSEISIGANPQTVIAEGNTTLSGKIILQPLGNVDRVNVTIFYKHENDTAWTKLATVKTDADGDYRYRWTVPTRLGKYSVKASWEGDLPFIEGDESNEIIVDVVESVPFDIMTYLPYIVGGIIIVIAVIVLYFKKLR